MTGATAFQKATRGGEINQWKRQEFLSLYPNRHKSILKPSGCKGWVTLSRHASLSDDTLWNAISGKEQTIWGCRWGELTHFAVLDIDETSQYHNELGLARLKHALAVVGLAKAVLYQSSDSGGWHIYLFFSDLVETAQLHESLKNWITAEGFEVRNGQLEIFPSNNGLRLPLQRGFAWLDEQADVLIRREDLTETEATAKFLDALDANGHNWQTVQNRIQSRLQVIAAATAATATQRELKREEVEEDGFSAFFTKAGMIQEVYNFGRDYWQNGLTKPKQRHHAMLCVGHYLWYGDEVNEVRALPGIARAEQRAAAIEAWLKEKHNGFSEAVLRDDWNEILGDIRRACSWQASEGKERLRESYGLTDRAIDRLEALAKQTGRIWYPEDFKKGNVGREEGAREKIRAALVQLVDSGRRVTVRGLERLSGCKRETIRRHTDIWGVFRLSNGPGDLSLGGSVFSGPSEGSSSEEVQEKKEIPVLVFESSGLKSQDFEPELALCERAEAPICFSVFDSLRLKLFGATANNSTACETHTVEPSLPSSLAPGSNTGALSAIATSAGGSSLGLAVRSLNGFLPSSAKPPLGPLHLPQTGFFLVAPARARDFAPGSEPFFLWRLTRFFWYRTHFLYGAARNFRGLERFFLWELGHQSNRMWWHPGTLPGVRIFPYNWFFIARITMPCCQAL